MKLQPAALTLTTLPELAIARSVATVAMAQRLAS